MKKRGFLKKRVLSLVLVLATCLGLTVPAFAAQTYSIIWLKDDLRGDTVDGGFHDGLAPVEKSVKEEINYHGTGIMMETVVPKYGYVDKTGKVVVEPQYDVAWEFSEGMAVVGRNIDSNNNKRYGVINTSGQVILPLEYDWVGNFSEGMALIKKGSKYGFIDKTGQIVIPLEYDSADDFSEGSASVKKNGKWSFIDKNGREVLSLENSYFFVSSFHEGMAMISRQYASGTAPKHGFIDKTGKEIIPTEYVEAKDFSEGLAVVGIPDELTPTANKCGYIDKSGNIVIPFNYTSASGFSNGIATVSGRPHTDLKVGCIDKSGKVVIPLKYAMLEEFHNGLAQASTGMNDGFIDRNGKVVVPFNYVSVGPFSEGVAFVSKFTGERVIYGIMTIPGYSEPQQTQQVQQATGTAGFTDVSSSSPYADAIKWAVDKKITTGKTSTTFAPSEKCTNGQILTFLWRASGSQEPTIENPYTDSIPASFQKAAIWAYEKGLVSGTTFSASTPCTRAMTVDYIWKAMGSPKTSKNFNFSDVSSSAAYAQAVAWAVENGVTSGTGNGQFSPDATCTRGQIVTFLYRAMKDGIKPVQASDESEGSTQRVGQGPGRQWTDEEVRNGGTIGSDAIYH